MTVSLEFSLKMFRKMCRSRYFELEVVKAYEQKLVKGPVYLSLGQESVSAALSMVFADYHIFAQHRAHSIYLDFGGDPAALRDELLGLPTGCTGGAGGSPMLQNPDINMVGHHGLIGENVPLGVGFALAADKPVICFFGDGAAEEDYVMAAVGFAATHKLPAVFVCADNGLSILTPTSVRRSWQAAAVARAYGADSIDIEDDPWQIERLALKLTLPAFLNIRTCRHRWHSGIGTDGPPAWDRFVLVKSKLNKMGLSEPAAAIEQEERARMRELWQH